MSFNIKPLTNDDYDNICNKSNLKEEYDYLLPKNLNISKEIGLINLSKKNGS